MDSVDMREGELAARLKRLDAAAAPESPGFDYQGMLDRQAANRARVRRRLAMARGTASALVLAMVLGSVWRFTSIETSEVVVSAPEMPAETNPSQMESSLKEGGQPRLVRADTWLALAALEDHIATIDDALSDARLIAPRGAEVARLERTRAELLDSYTRVRYAEMLSANF
jgi:hypothetical protein